MSSMITIVAGSAIIGAATSAYAGKKSADAQEEAARVGSNTELEMYYQSREDMAPWRDLGEGVIDPYKNALLEGPGKFEESPGYGFVKSEAENAMTNRLSAGANVQSGRAAKEAGRYSAGLASQEYGNFWNRYKDKVNMLAGGVQGGQQVAGQMAQNSMATGQSVANMQTAGISGAGNAQAAGIMGAGIALNQGVSNYMFYKSMA